MKKTLCSAIAVFKFNPLRLARTAPAIVAGVLMTGCATHKPIAFVKAGAPSTAAAVRLEPGPIGVVTPPDPAAFRFDKGAGRIESASDAAGQAAGQMLETTTFYDPLLEMAAGGVRFALGPFAAAAGAAGPGGSKMPPNKLSESESDLTRAMALMAEQQHFKQCLLKAAGQMFPNRLLEMESSENQSQGDLPVSALLDARTEELVLERVNADDSFLLRIKTRVRLLRPTDNAVLYEQSFEFVSGTELFIDWTRHDALQSVANTGYRELAGQIVNQFFANATAGPILVGDGYRKQVPGTADSPILIVHQAGSQPLIKYANDTRSRRLTIGESESPLTAPRQFVSAGFSAPEVLDIYSTSSVRQVTFQRPLTTEEAVSEAVDDVEWSLDGLDNSHNSVVMLMASAAAIPMSLWKQTVGAVQGLSSKNYRAAEERLTAAARQFQPQEKLAGEVAQLLAPKTSQRVVLVRTAPSRPEWPGFPRDDHSLVAGDSGMALKIHVLSVALTGEGGVNPNLAFCLEAEASLLRSSDGEVLYSFPTHYRGRERKFTDWAAHDAQSFRQELERCYKQLGAAIVEELVSRGLLAPARAPYPSLANNEQLR